MLRKGQSPLHRGIFRQWRGGLRAGNCWWNCHWYQHGLAVAPRDVINATKSHLAVPWIPNKVGLCLEAPCTQLTRSLYPQGWILMPPPYWRCWRPCWWCWIPWTWSWSPCRWWRNPRWVGEALMTHYVVIHALTGSWYPRRRPSNPQEVAWWILTLGGTLVCFRWLKMSMKPSCHGEESF